MEVLEEIALPAISRAPGGEALAVDAEEALQLDDVSEPGDNLKLDEGVGASQAHEQVSRSPVQALASQATPSVAVTEPNAAKSPLARGPADAAVDERCCEPVPAGVCRSETSGEAVKESPRCEKPGLSAVALPTVPAETNSLSPRLHFDPPARAIAEPDAEAAAQAPSGPTFHGAPEAEMLPELAHETSRDTTSSLETARSPDVLQAPMFSGDAFAMLEGLEMDLGASPHNPLNVVETSNALSDDSPPPPLPPEGRSSNVSQLKAIWESKPTNVAARAREKDRAGLGSRRRARNDGGDDDALGLSSRSSSPSSSGVISKRAAPTSPKLDSDLASTTPESRPSAPTGDAEALDTACMVSTRAPSVDATDTGSGGPAVSGPLEDMVSPISPGSISSVSAVSAAGTKHEPQHQELEGDASATSGADDAKREPEHRPPVEGNTVHDSNVDGVVCTPKSTVSSPHVVQSSTELCNAFDEAQSPANAKQLSDSSAASSPIGARNASEPSKTLDVAANPGKADEVEAVDEIQSPAHAKQLSDRSASSSPTGARSAPDPSETLEAAANPAKADEVEAGMLTSGQSDEAAPVKPQEGFFASAKHGLAHMLHLDDEARSAGSKPQSEASPAKADAAPEGGVLSPANHEFCLLAAKHGLAHMLHLDGKSEASKPNEGAKDEKAESQSVAGTAEAQHAFAKSAEHTPNSVLGAAELGKMLEDAASPSKSAEAEVQDATAVVGAAELGKLLEEAASTSAPTEDAVEALPPPEYYTEVMSSSGIVLPLRTPSKQLQGEENQVNESQAPAEHGGVCSSGADDSNERQGNLEAEHEQNLARVAGDADEAQGDPDAVALRSNGAVALPPPPISVSPREAAGAADEREAANGLVAAPTAVSEEEKPDNVTKATGLTDFGSDDASSSNDSDDVDAHVSNLIAVASEDEEDEPSIAADNAAQSTAVDSFGMRSANSVCRSSCQSMAHSQSTSSTIRGSSYSFNEETEDGRFAEECRKHYQRTMTPDWGSDSPLHNMDIASNAGTPRHALRGIPETEAVDVDAEPLEVAALDAKLPRYSFSDALPPPPTQVVESTACAVVSLEDADSPSSDKGRGNALATAEAHPKSAPKQTDEIEVSSSVGSRPCTPTAVAGDSNTHAQVIRTAEFGRPNNSKSGAIVIRTAEFGRADILGDDHPNQTACEQRPKSPAAAGQVEEEDAESTSGADMDIPTLADAPVDSPTAGGTADNTWTASSMDDIEPPRRHVSDMPPLEAAENAAQTAPSLESIAPPTRSDIGLEDHAPTRAGADDPPTNGTSDNTWTAGDMDDIMPPPRNALPRVEDAAQSASSPLAGAQAARARTPPAGDAQAGGFEVNQCSMDDIAPPPARRSAEASAETAASSMDDLEPPVRNASTGNVADRSQSMQVSTSSAAEHEVADDPSERSRPPELQVESPAGEPSRATGEGAQPSSAPQAGTGDAAVAGPQLAKDGIPEKPTRIPERKDVRPASRFSCLACFRSSRPSPEQIAARLKCEAATGGQDIGALESALQEAREADCKGDEIELQEAGQALEKLLKTRQAAAIQKLQKAVPSRSVEAMTEAIAEAEAARVERSLVTKAKKDFDDLQQRAKTARLFEKKPVAVEQNEDSCEEGSLL